VTLRAGSSAAVFALVAIGAVLLVGDAVLKGAWDVAARMAGPALLVVWAAWLLLVRPSIRVQPGRAVVVNVGRITELPWHHVTDIRRRLQLIFDVDDDRSVEAWGSPFVSKRAKPGDDRALMALRSEWQSAPAGDASVVRRRPDVLALALGAAAVVATGLSLGVAR
jgi:hypothetical protein